MKLNGLAAVITGGASGLGKATAKTLADAGANVTVFDLDEAAGKKGADEIAGLFVKVDVTDDASVSAGLAVAEQAHGVARILVNCAGIGPGMKTISREYAPHSMDLFRKTVEVNLVGSFNMISKFASRAAAAGEIDGERGVIINTASVAAYDGIIGQAAYSASKGGVVGMTLPIARDLAQHKIRVVTIAPGIFFTPMLDGLSEVVRDRLVAQVPHPSRLGRPSEYGQLVESIISNPMLNGEVIRLDGAIRMASR